MVTLDALGQTTDYAKTYDWKVLEAIPRAASRASLAAGINLTRGVDVWHLFEVSYLDPTGKPVACTARLTVPSSSPNICESKSLKLYIGSLNFSVFESEEALIKQVQDDLYRVIKARVKFELLSLDALAPSLLDAAHCLDHLPITLSDKDADASLLKYAGESRVFEQLHTHLFRSHCPVTAQPDWATVQLVYRGRAIDHAALLSYLVSYRRHSGFHESCVEQIFTDLLSRLKPDALMVRALFTRRGGIDINPARATTDDLLPGPLRLTRQ